jgi:hypothetical protein
MAPSAKFGESTSPPPETQHSSRSLADPSISFGSRRGSVASAYSQAIDDTLAGSPKIETAGRSAKLNRQAVR